MPRPYPTELTPDISANAVATLRPRHMLLGMKVISDYSLLESRLLMLATSFAKADPVTAGAMFGAIRNSAVQRDVVIALAREATDGSLVSSLDRALKIAEIAGRARNAFAHKIWMADPQLPSDVVLVDPDRVWRIVHTINRNGGPGPVTLAAHAEVVAEIRAKLFLWDLEDIAKAEKDCANATAVVHHLSIMQDGAEKERAASATDFEMICSWYSV